MGGDQRVAARRAFIRDNHPDRGGDPQAFITCVQLLTPPATPPTTDVSANRLVGPVVG